MLVIALIGIAFVAGIGYLVHRGLTAPGDEHVN
jgi:preprotein translocase subunit Sss1